MTLRLTQNLHTQSKYDLKHRLAWFRFPVMFCMSVTAGIVASGSERAARQKVNKSLWTHCAQPCLTDPYYSVSSNHILRLEPAVPAVPHLPRLFYTTWQSRSSWQFLNATHRVKSKFHRLYNDMGKSHSNHLFHHLLTFTKLDTLKKAKILGRPKVRLGIKIR